MLSIRCVEERNEFYMVLCTVNLKLYIMSKISTKKLHEMKELFWKNNKHNALGEIMLPLFFNELIKRL